jgi:hypothetical protein
MPFKSKSPHHLNLFNMKNLLRSSLLLFIILLGFGAFSQTILWENNIDGQNLVPAAYPATFTTGDIVAPNITVSGIGISDKLTGVAVGTHNRYNASGWSITENPNANRHFYFKLTPDPGYSIDFSDLRIVVQSSTAEGPDDVVLRCSFDGFQTSIALQPRSGATTGLRPMTQSTLAYNLSAAHFQNITEPIEFRLYAYNALTAQGSFSVNAFVFRGAEPILLPVTFADLQATRNNGNLNIAWTTLTETNNSHFDIEISKDGNKFEKIATVNSKAVNGISNLPLNYQVSISLNQITGFAIPAVFALLAMGFKNRWRKVFVSFFLVAVLITACSKKESQSINTSKENIFVRIAQVDIDGTKSFSKIVKATEFN